MLAGQSKQLAERCLEALSLEDRTDVVLSFPAASWIYLHTCPSEPAARWAAEQMTSRATSPVKPQRAEEVFMAMGAVAVPELTRILDEGSAQNPKLVKKWLARLEA